MIAHVQFHEFLLAVERASHPELDGLPLIIGSTRTGRGFVALASEEARERGVRTGMPIAEAVSLAPDAHCLPGSIERYLEVSAQIDETLRRFTSRIEWSALDEAFLEIDTRGALEAIRHETARRFGMRAAIGVGSTKAAAAAASRLVVPAGILIVLPGYEARGLAADDRPVFPARAPKGIARGAMFGTCGSSQARGAVADLASDAAAALRRSHHAARQLRLRVRDHAGERMRAQKIEPAISSDAEILDAIDALARRLLHPGRELLEAAVFLTALVPIQPQLALFSSNGRRSA